MNKSKFTLLTAALALAAALTFSCSGDDSGGGGGDSSQDASSSSVETQNNLSSSSDGTGAGGQIKKASISGVLQKGPFVEGSKATLYELGEDLSQTGRSFTDIIADDKGSFEMKNVELVSPYAMLEASGYYRNEVTGEISSSTINLFAIADVREKDNVNVNIITHLEYSRVRNLVEGGKTVAEAKRQAQREILAVFGINSDGFKDSEDMSIFGNSESDAALLAISVLLQGDLSEGQFSQRLTNFSQAIRNGGVPGEAAMAAMADWAAGADLASIRENILGWGLSPSVPDFEKYVYGYWVSGYGLGDCDAGSRNGIKNSNRGVYYACKGKGWEKARYIDIKCFESGSCLTFADARDGRSYFSVEIGGQTWMAENLNYNADGSKCGDDGYSLSGNNTAYCDTYGRLYDWETAMAVCPSGWRLPSIEEWDILTATVEADDSGTADTKLKATNGWGDFNGTDEYGFAALSGGAGGADGYYFAGGDGSDGRWWSSSANSADYVGCRCNTDAAAYRFMAGYSFQKEDRYYWDRSMLLSVRCLKN